MTHPSPSKSASFLRMAKSFCAVSTGALRVSSSLLAFQSVTPTHLSSDALHSSGFVENQAMYARDKNFSNLSASAISTKRLRVMAFASQLTCPSAWSLIANQIESHSHLDFHRHSLGKIRSSSSIFKHLIVFLNIASTIASQLSFNVSPASCRMDQCSTEKQQSNTFKYNII